ncbi:MAG: Stk1 family PASTA domain-containing Ser/Thr kinase [Lawsonella sp.]
MEGLLNDRYELGGILGYGGMSEVRAATDTVLQREVAIKILRPDLARDTTFLERFRNEARNSARLNHPNIVAVHDAAIASEDDETVPYIVMELVRGQILRHIVKEDGALYPQRAMHIMADVCSALHYSHEMGIVHRDIKPGNIMITNTGKVKVMDFGIARVLTHPTSMTGTSEVMGTAQYLSPEQARGQTVDARSDIYSTGCVLYEAITGQAPFEGDSPIAIAYQHVQEPVRPPSQLNDLVPYELDAVVLKALAKNPDDRYQSAGEMEADLVTVLHGQTPTAMTSNQDTQPHAVLDDATLDKLGAAAGAGAAGLGGAADDGVGAVDGAVGDVADNGATTPREAGVSAPTSIAAMMAAAAASGQANRAQVSRDVKEETAEQRKPITETGVHFGPLGDNGDNGDDKADSADTTPPHDTEDVDSTAPTATLQTVPVEKLGTGSSGSAGGAKDAGSTAASDYKSSAAAESRDSKASTDSASEEDSKRTRLRRRLKKVATALAILIGVAAAGIVITEAITGVSIFASQVAVADVTNMKAEPAAEQLRSQGFTVTLDAEPSNTVPRGMVVRTDPAASTMVARGGRITVIVSSGKGPIEVPDVRGMKEKEAREKLSLVGLKVSKDSKKVPSSPKLKGKVVRLNVPFGSSVSPKQEIQLMIGTGDSSIYIPATQGMTVERATANLEDAGFKVETRYVDSAEKRGTVVGTNPREKANEGDTVTLLVSNGSQMVAPNLRGMERDAAIATLENMGWQGHITVVSVPTRNIGQAGLVSDQDPDPGKPISADEEVTLYVYQLQVL